MRPSLDGTAFDVQVIEVSEGFILARVTGARVSVFDQEGGGHRWQRVPPTERRGRTHTSTVTVAVLDEPDAVSLVIPPADLETWTTRGSGPGGQNRNKVESEVCIKHRPSGLLVRCGVERSQHQNRELALKLLRARLQERAENSSAAAQNSERRGQIGSGQRGDKIRTVRLQDGIVTDHRSGRKISVATYMRGELPRKAAPTERARAEDGEEG